MKGTCFKGASGGLETLPQLVAVYLGDGLNVKLPEDLETLRGLLGAPLFGPKIYRDLSFQEHDQKYKRHLSWQ